MPLNKSGIGNSQRDTCGVVSNSKPKVKIVTGHGVMPNIGMPG